MKAFVTGGTGFIGSHLVDALLADKNYSEVRCLVRTTEKWLKNKPYKKYKGDLHNIQVLKEAVKNVDVVFHLAGLVKSDSAEAFDHVNVKATENLLRVAQQENVSNMIVLSSLAAAGPSQGQPLTEESPMAPVSMYGRSKKKMEQMIHQIADNRSSITILRPPAVFGPREDQIYSFFKMANNHICPIVGDGVHPKISMVYVKDVIQACLKAVKHDRTGINTYFIAGESIHTWDEIRRTTELALGKKTIPIYIKPAYVKKIAGAIEQSASFFGIYPVINREKANELILEWTCSIEKAKNELQFVPEYSLSEGIARTVHWYKKHHWL
ncbi:MAG TPA: NAD-dependent epimerase/dehydratase family protein [Balneolaceae bacterium]|nr:NAD-dependent epimerase/dehydratase family protein [Balneolaceae bacterium]